MTSHNKTDFVTDLLGLDKIENKPVKLTTCNTSVAFLAVLGGKKHKITKTVSLSLG